MSNEVTLLAFELVAGRRQIVVSVVTFAVVICNQQGAIESTLLAASIAPRDSKPAVNYELPGGGYYKTYQLPSADSLASNSFLSLLRTACIEDARSSQLKLLGPW